MKSVFVVISFLLISLSEGYTQVPGREWGVGLRLGDPMGFTLKRYISPGRAWEFNLGRSGFYGYNYQKAFRRYDKFDDYEYRTHYLNSALGFQLHYLVHKDVGLAEIPGLEWYYGVGGQLRAFNVDYEYRYRRGGGWEVSRERVSDIDLGIDGILGIEYSWREVPLTVFAEINLFVELVDTPFVFYGQGGSGLRYYF